jgi:hypothetical protein
VVALSEIAGLYMLLETEFDISEPKDLFQDPRPTSIWDPQDRKFVTQIIPYDIENRLAQYAAEFHRFLVDSLGQFFKSEFSRAIDFQPKVRPRAGPDLGSECLAEGSRNYINVRENIGFDAIDVGGETTGGGFCKTDSPMP